MTQLRRVVLIILLLFAKSSYSQVKILSSFKAEFTKRNFYLYTEQIIINNSDSTLYFYYPSNTTQKTGTNMIELESMFARQTPLDLNKEGKCGKNLSFVMGYVPLFDCSFDFIPIIPSDSLKIVHRDQIRTNERQKKGIYTLQLILYKNDKMQSEVCDSYKRYLSSPSLSVNKTSQMDLYSYSVKFNIKYLKNEINTVSVSD